MEYNNESMLAIEMVLEDYMGQYGIVWNSSMLEVAGIEPATPNRLQMYEIISFY